MGGLRDCVRRAGERCVVSAGCLGMAVEGGPGPPSRFGGGGGGLGLVRPNTGVIGDSSWCFLMVSRAVLTEHGEGKQYIQVPDNNRSWKTK